ncbi:MAG: hypothetical protein H7Z17_13490 [Fuerstia sp.]|nr:hypothetical protein [Fuerstiella sp.]
MSSGHSDNSPRNPSLGDDPVAIRLYARSIDAALDVATLEAHGIAAEISGDTVGDTLNWYGLAVQKVELVVPRRKVAEAQRILAERLATQAANQRTDWVCSGCGEVNGREFDSCWSCGKTWSAEHDEEFVADTTAQPLPTENDPIHFIPEHDSNPYAPPIAGTLVEAAPGSEVDLEIQRAFRSVVLSLFFPPLVLYTFYLGAKTLSRISRNELPASAKQRRRLQWILIASIIMVPSFLFGFRLLQRHY